MDRIEGKMFAILLICLVTLTHAAKTGERTERGSGKPHWGYHGDHGPEAWLTMYGNTACGPEFKRQSPINIQTDDAIYDPNLSKFFLWYDPPKPTDRMSLVNNGHTVKLQIRGDYFVTGGGLNSVYEALQLHFHWGAVDTQGSEHTINGQPYPLEMHIVTWNAKKYSTVYDALNTSDPSALAVLGVWFEASEEDNEDVERVLKHLAEVQEPGASAVPVPAFGLKYVLPSDLSSFYRYQGSLTTPMCNEIVEWTVFKQTTPISRRQLRDLRSAFSSEMNSDDDSFYQLQDNFRPPQPLNGRIVTRSFMFDDEKMAGKAINKKAVLYTEASSSHMLLSLYVLIGGILIQHLL